MPQARFAQHALNRFQPLRAFGMLAAHKMRAASGRKYPRGAPFNRQQAQQFGAGKTILPQHQRHRKNQLAGQTAFQAARNAPQANPRPTDDFAGKAFQAAQTGFAA
ncbi:hypothetical protein GCWU000324_00642 [Kingella oralis ATCC 51147]|uniref:Uncharacterized protein n=1 Tax=Kingella oralis ATCC 51147 TaxID=629741 RepID=C4GET3_9NEIS|nr:hypothetical protein GCWU000324_00642 [Kingella oralis ATCC 51147]